VPAASAIEPRLTVGELARASGVAPSAVRFYETHGLITGERTAGNQRRFRDSDACRVKVIRVAQQVGLSVAEIKAFLDDLPDAPSATDWRRLAERLVQEATERIQRLASVVDDIVTGDKLCDLAPRHRGWPRPTKP